MLINISNQPPKFQQFGIAGCALSLAALQQWAEGCSGRGKERKTLVYGQIQQIPSQVLLRVDQRVRASHGETHVWSLFKFQARKCPVPRNIIQGKIQKKRQLGCPTIPGWAALLRLGDKVLPQEKRNSKWRTFTSPCAHWQINCQPSNCQKKLNRNSIKYLKEGGKKLLPIQSRSIVLKSISVHISSQKQSIKAGPASLVHTEGKEY